MIHIRLFSCVEVTRRLDFVGSVCVGGQLFFSLYVNITLVLLLRYRQFGCPRNPLLLFGHLAVSVVLPGIPYNFSVLVLASMDSR